MSVRRTPIGLVGPQVPYPAASVMAGRYFRPISGTSNSTSVTLANGTLRLAPWWLPRGLTIDRIGAEVTVIGDVGSKLRLGIYRDNGFAYPGALLLDAGQIAGDSATVQDLTVSQALLPGLYWIGGVVQSVVTTQPTVRVTNAWPPAVVMPGVNTLPTAGYNIHGYSQTGVTAALPGNFSTSLATTGSAPILHMRAV